jgi:hypothetical protein
MPIPLRRAMHACRCGQSHGGLAEAADQDRRRTLAVVRAWQAASDQPEAFPRAKRDTVYGRASWTGLSVAGPCLHKSQLGCVRTPAPAGRRAHHVTQRCQVRQAERPPLGAVGDFDGDPGGAKVTEQLTGVPDRHAKTSGERAARMSTAAGARILAPRADGAASKRARRAPSRPANRARPPLREQGHPGRPAARRRAAMARGRL